MKTMKQIKIYVSPKRNRNCEWSARRVVYAILPYTPEGFDWAEAFEKRADEAGWLYRIDYLER